MANFFVRPDGTATKANATDPTSIASSMSINTFFASTFSDGDVIYLSSRGGNFTLSETKFLPSGGSAPGQEITYKGEPGFNGVFDGQGIDRILFRQVGKSNVRVSDLVVQNLAATANNSAMVLQGDQSNIKYERITSRAGGGSAGSTVWEIIDDTDVEINDCVLDDTYTHAIGMHGRAALVSNRCLCRNNRVNAIHTIDQTSATLNDWVVYANNSAVGFYPSFYLEGSGTNVVNRPIIHVSGAQRGAFAVGTTSANAATVNNPVVIFYTGVNSFNFGVLQGGSVGTLTINNPIFYNRTTNANVAIVRATGSGATLNMRNPVCFRPQYFLLSTSDLNIINITNPLVYGASSLVAPGGTGMVAGYTLTGAVLTSEPKFIAAADGNFRPAPNSPCLGAGVAVSGLTTDADGNAIPGAVGYDIGPYSYMPGWTVSDGILPLSAQVTKGHALPIGVGKITIFEGVASSAQIEEAK